MSDAEFLASFERLEIPGSEFRHADHVRLAWIYLHDSEFAAGAERFCRNFRGYVRHIGAESKYHETITWFYLVTVFGRIRARPPASSWPAFSRSNPDLLDRGMGVLRGRYRGETLSSPLARTVFLLPDLFEERVDARAESEAPGHQAHSPASAHPAASPLRDAPVRRWS